MLFSAKENGCSVLSLRNGIVRCLMLDLVDAEAWVRKSDAFGWEIGVDKGALTKAPSSTLVS